MIDLLANTLRGMKIAHVKVTARFMAARSASWAIFPKERDNVLRCQILTEIEPMAAGLGVEARPFVLLGGGLTGPALVFAQGQGCKAFRQTESIGLAGPGSCGDRSRMHIPGWKWRNEMSKVRRWVGVVVFAAGCLGWGAAQATVTTYVGNDPNGSTTPLSSYPNSAAAYNDFTSGLSSFETNDLESVTNHATTFSLNYPTLGITATVPTIPLGGDIESVATGGSQGGQYAISPTQFLHAPDAGDFTITFDTPISAFGLYATDLGDAGGTLSLALYKSGSLIETLTNLGIPTGSGQNGAASFVGFIDPSQSYDEIMFGTNVGGEVVGYDNFTIGVPKVAAVPEPSSLSLLAVGVGALGLLGVAL
jgi:hypothetical protein